MAHAVSALDGIKYGFKLLWYFLAIAIVGGIAVGIGSGLMGASAGTAYQDPNLVGMLFGFLLLILGIAIVYAGILGTGYKVIADGVRTGTLATNESDN